MNILGAFCLGFICGVVFLWVLVIAVAKKIDSKEKKRLMDKSNREWRSKK